MANNEMVIFNGIKFRRYPESDKRSDRVYFVPGGNHRKQGIGRLHQEIWKKEHGPIPDGYHVHHADHDPLNNDLSNLVLIEAEEHLSHHGGQADRVARFATVHAQGIEAAKVWHRSEEGRAWHVEHGKRTWEGREAKTYVCEYCKTSYESLKPSKNRFCSNNCKTQARRVSGVDNVDKTCEDCGATYSANRYARATTCSRSCGMKMARRRTRERLAAAAA